MKKGVSGRWGFCPTSPRLSFFIFKMGIIISFFYHIAQRWKKVFYLKALWLTVNNCGQTYSIINWEMVLKKWHRKKKKKGRKCKERAFYLGPVKRETEGER